MNKEVLEITLEEISALRQDWMEKCHSVSLNLVAKFDTEKEAKKITKELYGKLLNFQGRVAEIEDLLGLSMEDLYTKTEGEKYRYIITIKYNTDLTIDILTDNKKLALSYKKNDQVFDNLGVILSCSNLNDKICNIKVSMN